MKILKHSFKIEELIAKGDDIVTEEYQQTCHFSLMHKGFGLFQSEYKQPLLTALFTKIKDIGIDSTIKPTEEDVSANVTKMNDADLENIIKLVDETFIKALACSSYCKIENGKVINNEVTQLEFKESRIYESISLDFEFIIELIKMVIDSIPEKNKKTKAQHPTSKKK